MQTIDAKLATKPEPTAVDQENLMTLHADGERLHKAGDHDTEPPTWSAQEEQVSAS
ncbi:hypothetical protein D9M69_628280 [compost metagenome]